MIAKDIINPGISPLMGVGRRQIDAQLPATEVLALLLDTKDRRVEVVQDGNVVGVVDESSMLDAIGKVIAPQQECSVVTIKCRYSDYSASVIARAVEDSNVHLIDLFTVPCTPGELEVTLRLNCSDPSHAVHNLERYGFEVTSAYGKTYYDAETAAQRLLELHTILNI